MGSGGIQSGSVLQCQSLTFFFYIHIFYGKVLGKGMSVPVLIN